MRFEKGKSLLQVASIVVLVALSGCNRLPPAPDSTSAPMTAGTTEPAPVIEPQSAWKTETEMNPVTGEVTKSAYLEYQGSQNIFVRKVGKKLEFYIHTDDFLETVENVESRISTVQYRFDAQKPVRQGWIISSGNNALFYPGNPKPFLAQMSKAKKLAIEYRPADRIPATVTFDVSGFPNDFFM